MPDDPINNPDENQVGGGQADAAPGADAAAAGAGAAAPAADANAQGAAAGAGAAAPGTDVNAQGAAAGADAAAPGADINARGVAAGAGAAAPVADVNAQGATAGAGAAGSGADRPAQGATGAGNGNGANGDVGAGGTSPHPFTTRDKIFTWLTVGQYAVLAAIGGIIVYYLFKSLFPDNTAVFLYSLSKPEVARGVITFLIAAGTVSLAVLLVMAAIMSSGSKDLDQRFGFGKELLTLLIGILGTIVGFYYGSAKENVTPLTLSPVALSSFTPAAGEKLTIDALITGGAPPYTYSLKFSDPAKFQDVSDQTSEGPIHHELDVPTVTANEDITFTIEIKDAKNQSITYNKDGKQKISLKATTSAATTPTSPPAP